jgi:hypothetical protein
MVGVSQPSNMTNFTVNSYNLTTNCKPQRGSWCVKPGSIYTNPEANFNYFPAKGSCGSCGDPYTYYSYWYRRFPNQTRYLNCYFLPSASVAWKNAYGYADLKNDKYYQNCNPASYNKNWNTTDGNFKYFE